MSTLKIFGTKGFDYDDVLIVPGYSDVVSRAAVDISVQFGNWILDTPVISANMHTVTELSMMLTMASMNGIGILHRFMSVEDQVSTIREFHEMLGTVDAPTAVSVGATDGVRAWASIEAGANIICIDIAHGHSRNMKKMLDILHDRPEHVKVIAGNVVTALGAQFLIENGADAIKVGVGPGKNCKTREVTGVGVPQLSAIADVVSMVDLIGKRNKVPIIADGGIRTSADAAKALGAGANFVMVGSLLSATHESPGDTVFVDGKESKRYAGMASFEALSDRARALGESEEVPAYRPEEGIVTYQEITGSAYDVVGQISAGLRSAYSYVGASDAKAFPYMTRFVERK